MSDHPSRSDRHSFSGERSAQDSGSLSLKEEVVTPVRDERRVVRVSSAKFLLGLARSRRPKQVGHV